MEYSYEKEIENIRLILPKQKRLKNTEIKVEELGKLMSIASEKIRGMLHFLFENPEYCPDNFYILKGQKDEYSLFMF